MFKLSWKHLGLAAVLVLSLALAACGGGDETQELELVYVEWDSEVASTHVIGNVLESQGFDVELTPIDNTAMWQAVADGEADGMVAAWLPGTHASQYEQFSGDVVELGPNLEGAKIGLVVPTYVEATTIGDLADYSEEFDSTITGIEAGSGVVGAAEQALTDYSLDGWEVQTSSSGAMATALGEAIDNEEPIVVTGWTPHWKFAKYDLKYLEDPEGTFGGAETIETMVREGLEEDSPDAYTILDQFNWTPADMESVMLDISNGATPEEAAATWVEANQDKVDEWIAGVE
ncbi:glycine betaine ABC transporter substrate-binding protein [Radiobacillus sp. PE A8.2]|uniref:glycine betaine ABC transporter substrate-binding protein n=1 Tax=Radiobacillus sp. PE A8.2 TaxID=3380349 RepID=UPI0038907772